MYHLESSREDVQFCRDVVLIRTDIYYSVLKVPFVGSVFFESHFQNIK